MLKTSRYCFLLAVAGCLLLAQPLLAAEVIKGNLVSAKWLERNLKSADVLLLDASPAPIYKARHIPGAVSVDIFTMLTFGIREMPLADVVRVYQSLGISPGKKIVI